MINTIISALKISLKECDKYEDQYEYIYQLNQVLNRYKVNLIKLIPNKTSFYYDPKEFYQIHIEFDWSTKLAVGLLGQPKINLRFSGILPDPELRKNKEITFNTTTDISSIIDFSKISSIKIDHYQGHLTGHPDFKSEKNLLSEHLGDLVNDMCFYGFVNKVGNNIVDFYYRISADLPSASLDELTTEQSNNFIPRISNYNKPRIRHILF